MAAATIFRQFLLLLSSTLVVLVPLTFCASDYEALLKLKKSLTNASALDSWVPGSKPCGGTKGDWTGLSCNNGRVTCLRLEGMGLSGKIDVDALVEIPYLYLLSVYNNSFTGNIPQINRLTRLKGLFLSNNKFSGDISPDYFAKMGSLMKVWLSNNNFTGDIPVSLAHLPRLVGLQLENNRFSGGIPDFSKPILHSFNVSNNQLVGAIPSSLSQFHGDSFTGNADLCGEQVGLDCNKTVRRNTNKIMAAEVALGVFLLLVLILFAIRLRRNYEKDIRKGNSTKVVEVSVSIPVESEVSIKSTPTPSSSLNDISIVSELVMVNDAKGVFGLSDLKIVRGIAEGLEYIHNELASLDVPHGNLKSSNVLLGPDYNPFLVDFGFQSLVDVDGLQALFAYKTPEAVQQKRVSSKSDVYCLGLIILEILTREMHGNEGTDLVQWVASAFSQGKQAELLDTEIEGCRESVGSMEKLLCVGVLCTETNPEQRLDIKEVIRMIKEIQVEE